MSVPRYSRDHSAVQRECALYRVYVLDPRTNYTTTVLGYIGETAREPFIRFMEHLYDQPFGDTIVGQPQVDPRVFGSKSEVWAAEKAAVEAERPLYNCEFNLANPDRIPIPVARRQREERDRLAGRQSPSWEKPTRPAAQPAVVVRSGFEWTPGRRRAAVLAGVWVALAGVLGTLFAHMVAVTGPTSLEVGAGGASALFAAVWYARLSRRKRRAVRRWLAGMAVAAGLSVAAWIVLAGPYAQAVSR